MVSLNLCHFLISIPNSLRFSDTIAINDESHHATIFACLLLIAVAATAAAKPRPIPVKVVVVTMFEVGEDTGDKPGELQYWVERDHLDRIYPLPAGYHAVRMNSSGEMAVLTGQGTANAAATIMALGLDPRFDLSHAYWIVAGIAGGSPDRASLGSAVWARWVVDGDLGLRDRRARDSAGLDHGLSAAAQDSPIRAARRAARWPGIRAELGPAEWAFQSHPRHPARRLRPAEGRFAANSTERPPSARPLSPWATRFPLRPTGTANSSTPGPRNG